MPSARKTSAAMMAMSTHARTGWDRTALGSVAMKVVHDSPCPVLVQKPLD
jgi:nucleotide-binding universal stress UspA family protein